MGMFCDTMIQIIQVSLLLGQLVFADFAPPMFVGTFYAVMPAVGNHSLLNSPLRQTAHQTHELAQFACLLQTISLQRTRATNGTTRPSPNNQLQLGVLHRTNLSETAGTQVFDFQSPVLSNLCRWLNRPKINGLTQQTAFKERTIKLSIMRDHQRIIG